MFHYVRPKTSENLSLYDIIGQYKYQIVVVLPQSDSPYATDRSDRMIRGGVRRKIEMSRWARVDL